MRASLCVALVSIAGCGRIAFSSGDASDDSASLPRPAVVTTTTGVCFNCSTLPTTINMLPSRGHRLLLVSVAVGLGGMAGTSPQSTSVDLDGAPLSLVMRLVHQTDAFQPVLEQWLLVDPPLNTAAITVTLAGTAATLLVGAAEIEGVRSPDPIRASDGAALVGQATAASVTSDVSDLVVDSLCTGDTIDMAVGQQTMIFERKLGNVTTCGNLASSTSPGAAVVTMRWNVNSMFADIWIGIATSIAPGP